MPRLFLPTVKDAQSASTSKVREMGRVSTGVRGMTLGSENDEIIGMITMTGQEEESVMVVSENGYGKRSALEDYRITNRGGKGVKTMSITEKTGLLVAIKNVNDNNDLMIINQSGITLRLPVDSIRVMGRATQGVKLIDLGREATLSHRYAKLTRIRKKTLKRKSNLKNGNENIENIEHPESDNVSDNIVDAEI